MFGQSATQPRDQSSGAYYILYELKRNTPLESMTALRENVKFLQC